jgi:gamma-glutamylcyclotransferase (GGCT)/AIG2-like uncharacterized protein YtfP
MIKMFSYGMNTNINSMKIRCPTATVIGTGWVNNFSLVFRYYADVQTEVGKRCYGVVWQLTEKDLASIDQLEGYPHYYTRFPVKVNMVDQLNAAPTQAIVYQMIDQSFEELPSNGYYQTLAAGYQDARIPLTQLNNAVKRASRFRPSN